MKAIEITTPGELGFIEIQKPKRNGTEALLRVLYCGICGADVASYTGNQPFTTYPRIPGHEFSAQIVDIGDNGKGLKVGDIVTANPYFNCGCCYACKRGIVNACTDNQTMGVQRDGAYCDYIVLPVDRIIPGKGLAPQTLALIEPFAISRHALSRCTVKEGDALLIMGAGPIGLFALLAAKAMGAKVAICDMLESRLSLAKSFGADMVIDAKKEDLHDKSRSFTNGNGYDVCVEACGAPETFLNCIDEAAHGAAVVLIGNGKRETTFLHSVMLKKELNVFGSRNALTEDFEALIDLVAKGGAAIETIISRVYEKEDAAQAFEALKNNDGSLAKLLLRFADAEV